MKSLIIKLNKLSILELVLLLVIYLLIIIIIGIFTHSPETSATLFVALPASLIAWFQYKISVSQLNENTIKLYQEHKRNLFSILYESSGLLSTKRIMEEAKKFDLESIHNYEKIRKLHYTVVLLQIEADDFADLEIRKLLTKILNNITEYTGSIGALYMSYSGGEIILDTPEKKRFKENIDTYVKYLFAESAEEIGATYSQAIKKLRLN